MEGMSAADDIEIKLYTSTDEHKIHIVSRETRNIRREDDAGFTMRAEGKKN